MDPSTDPDYNEPSVDDMRAQKDEMLERYRKQAERRARELAAKHSSSESGTSKSKSGRKAAPPADVPGAGSGSRRGRGNPKD